MSDIGHREGKHRYVFLVASERSGTTWLQLLLGQFSEIATAQETHLFSRYLRSFHASWAADRDNIRPVGLRALYSEGDFWCFYRRIATEVLSRIGSKKPGSTLILEKTPFHLYEWSVIRRLFPDCFYILLMRDPRAVVSSLRATGLMWDNQWAKMTVADHSRAWARAASTVQEISSSSDRCLLVYYEDLNRRPCETLSKVAKFLSVDADAKTVQRIVDSISISNLKQNTVKDAPWDLSMEPKGMYRQGLLDAWKEELSTSEIALVQRLCGDMMECFGYEVKQVNLHNARALMLLALEKAYKLRRYVQRKRRVSL